MDENTKHQLFEFQKKHTALSSQVVAAADAQSLVNPLVQTRELLGQIKEIIASRNDSSLANEVLHSYLDLEQIIKVKIASFKE